MDNSLISIKGIGLKTIEKFSSLGINTIDEFVKNASTPLQRTELSKSTTINEGYIYSWVKQADLMRVENIDAVSADMLVQLGVRGVKDLVSANTEKLAKMVDSYNIKYPTSQKRVFSPEIINTWKENAALLDSIVVYNADDLMSKILIKTNNIENSNEKPTVSDNSKHESKDENQEKNTEGSKTVNNGEGVFKTQVKSEGFIQSPNEFFTSMANVIVDLGKGISQAQAALDINSIETQQKINDDEFLRNSGIMASWYTIPEATFNLKMDYAVSKENSSSNEPQAKRPISNILISPVNARYKNYFKISQSMQSELNLKFVPVPSPTKFSHITIMPLLKGKSLEDAKKLLNELGIMLGNVTTVEGVPSDGMDNQVVEQFPDEGDEIRFSDKISIKLVKK